jgi:hypothetical protein
VHEIRGTHNSTNPLSSFGTPHEQGYSRENLILTSRCIPYLTISKKTKNNLKNKRPLVVKGSWSTTTSRQSIPEAEQTAGNVGGGRKHKWALLMTSRLYIFHLMYELGGGAPTHRPKQREGAASRFYPTWVSSW